MNRKFFFDFIKKHLFIKLSQSQVEGLIRYLDYWEAHHADKDDRWLAYILASVFHETGRKMQPVEEIGRGKGKPYGQKIKYNRKTYVLPDKLYFGRGDIQLTWYELYEKVGKLIGVDLLNNPELALIPENSVEIAVEGCINGWFTGAKLSRFFNEKTEDWVNARRIVNVLDKAKMIGDYAKLFYAAISYK